MVAGDGEEHFIEGRAAKPDVVEVDASLVKQADDGAELICAAVDRGGNALTVRVGVGRLRADPSPGLTTAGMSLSVRGRTSSMFCPARSLSWSGVHVVMTRPWSMMTMWRAR